MQGDITWETSRTGQPGKCSFSLIPDQMLKIEEGNAVRLDVNGVSVFFGFVFERNWNSDRIMKVTAYDQLRYLKNKDTYNYENQTASEVIRMIAADYNLQTGELADTKDLLTRNENNKTLFDIIITALDLTMIHTGNLFVFYDDVGKLTLKNMEEMELNLLIDSSTAQDFDFKISIDGETYNQIRLYYDNSETNKQEVYMTKHSENINKWGVLQMDESIDQGIDGQVIAERYLALYNRPASSLSVKGAFGDIRARAGCRLPVILEIQNAAGLKINNYLVIETVTHKIEGVIHTMDLVLRGAWISG